MEAPEGLCVGLGVAVVHGRLRLTQDGLRASCGLVVTPRRDDGCLDVVTSSPPVSADPADRENVPFCRALGGCCSALAASDCKPVSAVDALQAPAPQGQRRLLVAVQALSAVWQRPLPVSVAQLPCLALVVELHRLPAGTAVSEHTFRGSSFSPLSQAQTPPSSRWWASSCHPHR